MLFQTQSAARLNRVMAGAGGATGGGLAGEAPGPGGERPGPPGGGPKMDVVYVTERIISLAFPPALDDATYTLHLREVAHMLSSKHGDNFKVSEGPRAPLLLSVLCWSVFGPLTDRGREAGGRRGRGGTKSCRKGEFSEERTDEGKMRVGIEGMGRESR